MSLIIPKISHDESGSFDWYMDAGVLYPDWNTDLKVNFYDSTEALKFTATISSDPALIRKLDIDDKKYTEVTNIDISSWAVGNVIAEVFATVGGEETNPYPFQVAAFEIIPVTSDCVLGLLDELELRWRFSRQDNFLEAPPTDDEMIQHIYDSLDEINSHPPQTFFSMEQVCNRLPDPRWRTLLIYGAAKNILTMLMNHWNSEGFDGSIEELSVQTKYGDYSSELSDVTTQFNERLEKLKMTSQRFAKGIRGTDQSSLLTSVSGFVTRWYKR